MNDKRVKLVALAVLALAAGCSRTDPDGNAPSAETAGAVTKTIKAKMESGESLQATLGQTRTALLNFDTSHAVHPVCWKPGDIIYDYAESGVYMQYRLVDTDILDPFHEGTFIQMEVLYRIGDRWVTCYCKGSAVGGHIGYRTQNKLVLANAIPSEQDGTFEPYHICIAQGNPETDFLFRNMQAYLRFEIKGADLDATLLSRKIKKIELTGLDNEIMSGDQVIINDGEWRCNVQENASSKRMITIIPEGGEFKTTATSTAPDKIFDYFVAVPARRYGKGLRFTLYSQKPAPSTDLEGVAQVDVPSSTLLGSSILNCHDLLMYCVIFVNDISLKYGDIVKAEYGERPAGIEVMENHTGTLIPTITPATATNQSLRWESSDPSVVSVGADGTITGQEGKAGSWCWIRVFAKDRDESLVARDSVKVTVTVDPEADALGGYAQSGHSW